MSNNSASWSPQKAQAGRMQASAETEGYSRLLRAQQVMGIQESKDGL